MGPREIDEAVGKIFDLLNDNAKEDEYAKKFLTDLLTDVFNEGYNYYANTHDPDIVLKIK
jgi:hypothetical protein